MFDFGRQMAVAVLALLVWAAPGWAQKDWVESSGDLIQVALPVLGWGATFFTNPEPSRHWDRAGSLQFLKSYGLAWTTTRLVKLSAGKMRPEGTSRTSFPSGHTMSAFAGAAFIDGRYGRGFGVPAYALAVWTGYSRVHAHKHYTDDVLAGASIGLFSNWLFVSPLPGRVQLVPTISAGGYGLQVTVGGPGDGAVVADDGLRGVAFSVEFGEAMGGDNWVGAGSDRFNLAELDGVNDPTATAVVALEIPAGERTRVRVRYAPFEARDEGAFGEDVHWGGMVVASGTPVASVWRLHTAQVAAEWEWVPGLRGEVGLGWSETVVSLTVPQTGTENRVVEAVVSPTVGAVLEMRLAHHWSVRGEGRLGGDRSLTGKGELVWAPSPPWDVAAGLRYWRRSRAAGELVNEVGYRVPYLGLVRYW